MNETGIYIHIPFCSSKCGYCDFNSYDNRGPLISPYVDALVTEIGRRKEEIIGREIKSVFFGGGTPTLLSPAQVNKIMETCRAVFNIGSDAEITLEANPGTVDQDYLRELRNSGINRVSIGAQSFNDGLLKKLGRGHGADDAEKAVKEAIRAGFGNVSIDLIFAIPGGNIQEWEHDLETAVSLGPDHISMYNLTIEEGSRYYNETKTGKFKLPPEEVQAEMYKRGIEALAEKGYNQYEISNFARQGMECLHNLIYWENREYAGFGAGACSYIKGVRKGNIKSPEGYIGAVNGNKDIFCFSEELPPDETMRETVIMNLRTIKGLNKDEFKARFGDNIEKVLGPEIEMLAGEGLLVNGDGWTRLSPKGLLFSNNVFMEFMK